MANDISSILGSLQANIDKLDKVKNAKDVGAVIDSLYALADEAAGFGGKVAQILPTNVRMQADALTKAYNSYRSIAETALSSVQGLKTYIESIPLGQLTQKSVSTADTLRTPEGTGTPVVPETAPVEPVSPQAPQSAIAQSTETPMAESLTLESLWKKDFSDSPVYENFKDVHSFDRIAESAEIDAIAKNLDMSQLFNESSGSIESFMAAPIEENEDMAIPEPTAVVREQKLAESAPAAVPAPSMKDAMAGIGDIDFGIDLSI